MKFLDVDERDSLRSYLISLLERTRKTVNDQILLYIVKFDVFCKDVTQRMMLATWLVEIYLSKCNDLDDVVASESVSHDISDLQAERTIIEDDLRQFLETYKVSHPSEYLRIQLSKIPLRPLWTRKPFTS